MSETKQNLTLDCLATYNIKVQGYLDENWLDWGREIMATVEGEGDDPPVTSLTGTFDQAALQGLLRRLYLLGLPLISVQLIMREQE